MSARCSFTWWEIHYGDNNGPIIAGGESNGLVEGVGGEVTFTLTADGMGQTGEVRGVELVVHTGLGASTLIVQIDNLPPFTPEGGFEDHRTYNFPVAIPEGPHMSQSQISGKILVSLSQSQSSERRASGATVYQTDEQDV